MIDRDHRLSVSRQCQVLGLPRSTAYYQPVPVSTEGKMGIEALYRKPNLSRRHASHPIYPYLLRHLNIDRPNQVWATDITYIPMRRGFVYLVAIMDWYSRRVLAWRLSNTLSTDFCVEALEEAIARYGTPEIFNTDQGSQFTSVEFTDVLKTHGIRISMDGKGCWRDNVFVERLWKSVKYEEVYLHAYDPVWEARTSIMRCLDWYNRSRPHARFVTDRSRTRRTLPYRRQCHRAA